jgi:hypothetical protein
LIPRILRKAWPAAAALTIVATALAAGCSREPAPQYAGPKVALRPFSVPGRYVQEVSTAVDFAVAWGGEKDLPVHLDQLTETAMDVSAPEPDGRRTLKLTTRRVKVGSPGAGGGPAASFDSDLPDEGQDDELAAALRPLVKTEIVARIGPDDRVTSVEGMDRLYETLAEASPEKATQYRSMKSGLGDASARELFDAECQTLPDHPVEPGDRWEAAGTVDLPLLGKTRLTLECRLKDIETTPGGRVAVIAVTGGYTQDKPKTLRRGGGAITITRADVKQTGEIRFNLDTGLSERRTAAVEGGCGMTVSGPGQDTLSGDMTIRIAAETTTRAARP